MHPRKRAAVSAGVADGTLANYGYVVENATDEVKARLAAGELTVHGAYTITYNALAENVAISVAPIRTEKLVADLQAFSAALKNLPALVTRTQAAVKSLASAKVAEHAQIAKKFANAAKIIVATENDQTLAALREALAGNNLTNVSDG